MSWKMLRKIGCVLVPGDVVLVLEDGIDEEDSSWRDKEGIVEGGKGSFVRVRRGKSTRSLMPQNIVLVRPHRLRGMFKLTNEGILDFKGGKHDIQNID